MATAHEQNRLVAALQQAVKSNVMPVRSTEPGVCGVCEGEIEIGTNVVTLPGPKKSTTVVCGDCFELYQLCPGPRPTE